MTIFDLLFLVLFLTAAGTLLAIAVAALRGRRARALTLARRLICGVVAYLGVVYAATALSTLVVLHAGDAECSDDWCIAVDGAQRTAKGAAAEYHVKLRIFSRALGRPQRELAATDVYLVDSLWRRYNPVPNATNIPLNTLLQPGESIATERVFEVPAGTHSLGLRVGRSGQPVGPICLIIGECEAFHKGTVIRID
jgi:hypothetical protein